MIQLSIPGREETALNDSLTFALLHCLFRFPTGNQWEWINRADVRTALGALFRQYGVLDSGDPEPYPAFQKEYEESYIRLFEAGAPNPPCPLIESYWNKRDPVPRILHENILFYKTFGVRLKKEVEETADHLRFQLEFYRYLAELAAKAAADPADAGQYYQIMQARRDYLQRHLLSWTPLAVEEIEKTAPDACYATWMHLLRACADDQYRRIEEELKDG
ncbi:MAG: molecular chaperone TorD family protein [Candidatus Omnitrophota bacterium]